MECGDSVSLWITARRFKLLAMLVLLGSVVPAMTAERVVLIANAKNPVTTLNSLVVQKLFLGLTVPAEGGYLRPLRNESDELMRQIFYQNVISMSEPTYERRLLALTLQQGRTSPPIYRDTKALLNAIADDPFAVSYARASEVTKDPRVKILRILWQE